MKAQVFCLKVFISHTVRKEELTGGRDGVFKKSKAWVMARGFIDITNRKTIRQQLKKAPVLDKSNEVLSLP